MKITCSNCGREGAEICQNEHGLVRSFCSKCRPPALKTFELVLALHKERALQEHEFYQDAQYPREAGCCDYTYPNGDHCGRASDEHVLTLRMERERCLTRMSEILARDAKLRSDSLDEQQLHKWLSGEGQRSLVVKACGAAFEVQAVADGPPPAANDSLPPMRRQEPGVRWVTHSVSLELPAAIRQAQHQLDAELITAGRGRVP